MTDEESDWSRDDWGLLVEQAVCDRYSARLVANSDDHPDWVDAIVQEPVVEDGCVVVEPGDVVQVKATVFRQREYRSSMEAYTRRRGRYFIREHGHRQLLDSAGAYALGVYDPALADANPITLTLVDAREVDGLDLTWCSNGSEGLEAARLNWRTVFDVEDVADRRDELLAEVESNR